ncbi:AAA family ATPase [Cryobacterium sp. TMT2-23]|uniref:MinD/ParA family ATP-binding protein n=1 Tax=Cryobacterium sp. TMT2-23 TaxID=1259252 RepID=UPI00106BDD44|nr:AAA family ATPase [Cryobacterium sp. TMT2-23]TFD29103.1 ATPase [Cryobacterium sp. TMT2-23]
MSATTTAPSSTATRPRHEVRAVVNGNSAQLSVLGTPETLTADTYVDVRKKIMTRVMKLASGLGSDVHLVVDDQTGHWRLIAGADGELHDPAPTPDLAATAPADAPAAPSGPTLPQATQDASPLASVTPLPAQAPAPAELPTRTRRAEPPADLEPEAKTAVEDAAEVAGEEPATGRAPRASFIVDERREPAAANGWRGFITRATGLQVPASTAELERRGHVQAVSQHWPGPRKISIVNGKGGVGKTLTTAMLTAVFARHGGAGVLAWDNNDTRGTLGWRTEKGPHDATVQDLLPATSTLLSPGAQISDLARFVHHQTGDKYDVLRSNPELLATKQRITQDDFDALHEVAAKYFRLVFFDSGNDESAPRWLRMIDHTDQLVVATTALGESAESGALLLEALTERDEHSANLARNAVVVVLQSEQNGTLADAQRIADGFTGIARAAVTIPFDRALHGGALRYDAVSTPTRNAWLAAGAAVAAGL